MKDHVVVVCHIALTAGLLVGGACGEGAGTGAGGNQIALHVAPLDLPTVSDACYGLTVTNGLGQTVMSETHVCSRQYGAVGGISYVAPCDADPAAAENTVSLVLEQICSGSACVEPVTTPPALATDTWANPCPATAPCSKVVTCKENQDVPVSFDLTVARDAEQGFFDIAVNFEDMFCSAKVDCEYVDGSEVKLLHNAGGARDSTIVMAFACTSGPGGADTTLHMDDVVLECPDASGGTTTVTYDPAPAALGVQLAAALPVGAGPLFQVLVAAGVELFSGIDKIYWTVSFGVNLPDAIGCVISTRFTASQGTNDLAWVPPGFSYPVIDVTIPIGADSVDPNKVTCGGDNTNGLDGNGTVIQTDYIGGSDQGTGDGLDNCATSSDDTLVFCDDDAPTSGADVSLEKTVDDTTPAEGATVFFELTVSNAGPDTATGVAVTDQLPSGYLYKGDSTSGVDYDPDTGVWTVGSVAAGDSVTITIFATVLLTGDHTNKAEITASDQSDPDSTPANQSATEDDYGSAAVTPTAPGVACPCWTTAELNAVVTQLTGLQYSSSAGFSPPGTTTTLSSTDWGFTAQVFAGNTDNGSCAWNYTEPGNPEVNESQANLTPEEADACQADLDAWTP